MKLYISYYENYISIVEGIYDSKKDKYNIKNIMSLSSDDVKLETNEKYGLLKEALKLNKFKSKDVVFLLNTRDIIVKSNNMSKVNPKDLDGIMNNEIYEMMSLDEEQYTFSYEVTNERITENEESLEVITAAIANNELNIILDIFKEFKLNLECIDTMSTAYIRLLNDIDYDDIMVINTGMYGSSVNIYKQNSLFIYDNIPIRINSLTNYNVVSALVDEVKGLMNFYSSRNFGKSIDTILIVGEASHNQYIKEIFNENFNDKIVIGIENLFDITDYIQGDIQQQEISEISEILGSMYIDTNKNKYSYINLLPTSLKNRLRKAKKLKTILTIVPIGLLILSLPYFTFTLLEHNVEKNAAIAQQRLDEIIIQYKDIQTIEEKIKSIKEEIAIYDMISSKKTKWETILSAIEKNIPYRADLTSMDIHYDSSLLEEKSKSEENNKNENEESKDENTEANIEEAPETEIYNQIPNVISIEGVAITPEKVGQFVYALSNLDYFKSVDLKSSVEDKEKGVYNFNIVLELKEGVVSGE